jgi:hypothetical protein
LTQKEPSLREQALRDLDLFSNLLQISKDNEEIQRDAVCAMAEAIMAEAPVELVTKVTMAWICLLDGAASTTLQCEVLNVMMDLYGQDDFYPQVFASLNVLGHFQKCISKMPKTGLEPESEEIVFNGNRFVDYKLGR